jgi:transcriptional regulator with GAF, ATPase, and Fis domain
VKGPYRRGRDEKGELEAAGDGTLFLDDIGDLAPPMQAKLLRVLQQKELERVGGAHSIPFKARVLAATNKNLEQASQSQNASFFNKFLTARLSRVSLPSACCRSLVTSAAWAESFLLSMRHLKHAR